MSNYPDDLQSPLPVELEAANFPDDLVSPLPVNVAQGDDVPLREPPPFDSQSAAELLLPPETPSTPVRNTAAAEPSPAADEPPRSIADEPPQAPGAGG